MKILFTFLLTLVTGAAMAQCGNSNTLAAGSLTPPGVGQSNTLTYNSGQYVLAYVQSGASYTVSTCGGNPNSGTPVYDPWDDEWYYPGSYDTQLTVYNDGTGAFIAYNDDACGLQSTVSFTATFCGYIRILLHQYSCNGSNLPWKVTMTQNTAGATQTFTLSAVSSQTNVTCFGAANGTATIQPSGTTGAVRYSWSPSGGTAATATGLAPGTYTVTATDAACNGVIKTFTITEPSLLTASSSKTNATCNGVSNGTATVTPSGGTAPYTYSWSPSGGTDAIATGLAAGTYTATVTDAKGCTATASATITEPAALTATASGDGTVVEGGTINLSTGTISGATYAWTGPNSFSSVLQNPSISNVTTSMAGTYSVTYTMNGCTSTAGSTTVAVQEITAKPLLITPANATSVTINKPTYTGTATANSMVRIYVDGSLLHSTTADLAGSFSYTQPTALTDGSHTFYATAELSPKAQSVNSTTNTFLVNTQPTITISGTLTPLSTTYGQTSTATQFSVTATNMQAGVLITPPAGFEVSVNNNDYASTATLGSSGTISGTVYIRLSATAGYGNYSGNILLSSTGATTVNAAMGNSSVSRRSLIIIANNVDKVYGQSLLGGNGSTTFTSNGLQNGETIGSVTVAYGTGAAANAAVGSYTGSVTPSAATGGTFTASNYTVTYTTGNIIVGTATLNIAANNVNKTYGQTLVGATGATAFTPTGLQNGETVGSVTVAYGTGAATNAAVGTYAASVTPSAATGGTFSGSNYAVTYTTGNIIVGTATLNIAANNANKIYGQALVGGTGATAFTPTGLQNGETIGSVTVAYGTGAAANAAVGTYAASVTPSAATGGTFTASNYTVTYSNGNIIIGTATLNIAANNVNKTYGQALVGGTGATAFTPTGLQNGETIGSVTVAYGTGAAANAAVGTYTGSVTPSVATGGTFTASNYTVTYSTANIIIGTATLNIAANNVNKTYGQTLFGATGATAFTPTGLQNGETVGSVTVAYGTGAAANAAVGTYAASVTPSAATGGTFTASNYTVTYSNGNIIVGTATLNIAANNVNKTYGQALVGGTGATAFTPTGLQNGETIGSVTVAYGTGAAANAAVGTYAASVTPSVATGGTFTASNYTVTYSTGNIIVGTATLNIAANNVNKTYGQTLTGGTGATAFTPTGLQNGETIGSVTVAYGTGAAANASVGTYAASVTPSAATGGTFTALNYTVTYSTGNITIGTATLNIAVNNVNKTYGQTLVGATGSTAFTPTGLQNGETVGSVTVSYGTGAAANAAVGTYAASVTPSAATGGTFTASNYTVNYSTGNIIVGTATLNIAANNVNKTYGQALVGGTGATAFTPTGLQNGETIGSVTVAYGTGAAANAAVGTYAASVTPSAATGGTFSASNYAVTYTTGNIIVGTATLIITANNVNKTYGQTLTGGTGATAFTPTGLQNGETIGSVTVAYGTGAAANASVGTYAASVNPSAATGGTFTASNYTVTYSTGNIVIGSATLNIAANNVNKTYGQALVGATGATAFTPTGLQNGETIGSVTVAYGTGAAANAAVGTYAASVTPSAATGGTFSASNYAVTYTTGNIIVGTATLNIAANNVNKTYGQTLVGATGATAFTPTGLQNGETIGSVAVAYSTGAAANAAVGTYAASVTPSTATGGTFTASNYTVTYSTGNIIVGTATLNIAANNVNKTYGQALVGGTGATAFTPTGLQNGETIGSVTVAYGTGAAANASVGNYTGSVTPSAVTGGTFTASNYSISYAKGNIIVGAKALTITANNVNKVYGQVLTGASGLTSFTSSGLENGETIGSVAVAYGTGAAANASVGNYTGSVTPSVAMGGTFMAANYNISYVTGNIIVEAKPITVTAAAKAKTYGDTDPTLSYGYTGTLVGSDNFNGAITRVAGENAGSYAIEQGTLSLGGNYAITYVGANLVINRAVITVSANSAVMCQGNNLPAFGVSYSGFRFSDNENSLSAKPAVTTSATRTSAAGTYALIPGGGASGNYTFTYVNGQFNINALPVVTIVSSAGLSVSKGATLQLTATGAAGYSWSNVNGIISGQQTAILTVRPSQTTTYTVSATNDNGCNQSTTITIEVREDFELISGTNILTPNGDGKNDYLVIRNIDMYQNNEIKIFDIAGRVVYSKKSYDNTWDGTFNGSPLTKGTYYYIIDFGGGKLKRKGFVSIVRD